MRSQRTQLPSVSHVVVSRVQPPSYNRTQLPSVSHVVVSRVQPLISHPVLSEPSSAAPSGTQPSPSDIDQKEASIKEILDWEVKYKSNFLLFGFRFILILLLPISDHFGIIANLFSLRMKNVLYTEKNSPPFYFCPFCPFHPLAWGRIWNWVNWIIYKGLFKKIRAWANPRLTIYIFRF